MFEVWSELLPLSGVGAMDDLIHYCMSPSASQGNSIVISCRFKDKSEVLPLGAVDDLIHYCMSPSASRGNSIAILCKFKESVLLPESAEGNIRSSTSLSGNTLTILQTGMNCFITKSYDLMMLMF